MNLPGGGLAQDKLDVVLVYASTGHDYDTVSGGANQVCKGSDAVRSPSLTRRGKYPRGAGLDHRLQTSVHILALVKGAMESNGKGTRQIHQLARPRDIDSPLFIEQTQHDSVHVQMLGHLNVALHDFELITRIKEVSRSRTDQDVNRKA